MDKPKKDGNFLSITAYDNFSLMEKGFFTDLSGNQKIKTILDEQCAKIGISFRGDADDVEYDVSLLEGSTVREAVSILAAYCGKNAIIDRNGNLKFVWYTDCGVTIRSNEYKDTLEYDEEDTFINRLECATNEETLSIGTGVGIFFSCPGMTETRLNELYNRIKGFTYRTIKIDWMIARPDIEAGDLLTVITTDGTQCKVPLMDFEIHCDGGCYGTIESKGKSESEQAHEFKSPTEKKISFVYEETISVKKILVDTINAWNGNFEEIETNYLQVNKKLTALEAEIKDLDVDELTAKVAEIERAYISKAEVEQLYATKAEIGILDTKIANIDKAIIDVAHIDDLEALNARIDNIQAGNIDTEALEAHFARIDLANIKDGCITTAMIGEGVIESAQIADGSITDAKIVTLTANKLTAGRIDASDIEVVNLNCANLTVGTINGHQITNGAIDWDKLASQVGDTINNADENASQALEDALKAYQEAQKANSAAGTAQSTANGKNTVIYASSQPSTSGRKTNDVWFDTDDSYKMYYFNGTAWVAAQFGTNAIKNASITTALIADAAINNAKIANLDAGKITSGYISSDRIQAGSIVIGKLDGSTQNTITTANSNASKALSDAAAASSKAGTAQSTADSALSKANTANSNANTALKSINIQDTRDTDEQPLYYFRNYPKRTVRELKYCKSVGLSGESYCELETTVPWGDKSGGYPTQIARLSISKKEYTRYGTSDTTWSEWVSLDVVIANWCYNNDKTYINGGKIYTGTVNAAQIAANAIIAGKIAANAVTTANLQADCVNADKIAAKSINAEHINGAIITGDKIVASAITGDKIAARTIDATKIVANTITAAEIKAGTITGNEIAAGTIDATKIKANSITATQIAANAVTAAKIATDAIKSRNYVVNSVGSFLNLADGTFTSKNLKWTSDGSLTGSNVNLTGAINATSGTFKGTITGSTINGNTITGGTIKSATISGNTISGNTISGGTISGASITGGSITSGTTINVTTNLTVGNNIYVGSYSDRNTQKYLYFNDRFSVYSRNDIMGFGLENGNLFSGKMYVNSSGQCIVNGMNATNIICNNGTILLDGVGVQINADNQLNIRGKDIAILGQGAYIKINAGNAGIGFTSGDLTLYLEHDGIGVKSNTFRPAGANNGIITLGQPSALWYRLYAKNAEYIPSDIRLKTNIRKYDKRFEDMYMEFEPVIYEMKDEIGIGHCGLIAQQVKCVMDKYDVSDAEFGVYAEDKASDTLGIIYQEIASLNMHMIQKTIKRVDAHDDEIARLKDKVTELQSKLNAYILGEMEVRT